VDLVDLRRGLNLWNFERKTDFGVDPRWRRGWLEVTPRSNVMLGVTGASVFG